MDVLEAINQRRSIRKYEEKAVEKEKLLTSLEAVRLAPSAMNRQPYTLIVISHPEAINQLSSVCNQPWEAPLIIAICAFPKDAWVRADGEEYWKADAAVAMTNLSLAAWAEGLGTCWIAAFKEEAVKKN